MKRTVNCDWDRSCGSWPVVRNVDHSLREWSVATHGVSCPQYLDDLSAGSDAEPDPAWQSYHTIIPSDGGLKQSRARRKPVNSPPKDGWTLGYDARGLQRFGGGREESWKFFSG